MKKIVICIDGTWNKPDENSPNAENSTNVFKISQAIAKNDRQIVKYIKGVGTSKYLLARLWEGYTGAGTTERIIEGYEYLIDNYEKGDEIYLFGFSRGAFAVRSLAGLIKQAGILRKDKRNLIHKAYQDYRNRAPELHPNNDSAVAFRKENSVEPVTNIKFIGVWDTVGSLGNPALPNSMLSKNSKFHDTEISSIIQNAYQALAICERRWLFEPCIWERKIENGAVVGNNASQVLEQRWFVGVHSNIGGGYKEAGLSNRALIWMIDKAKSTGLNFIQGYSFDINKGLCGHDEANKLIYKFKSSERVIGKKDIKVNEVYISPACEESLHDDVKDIMNGKISMTWPNPKYKFQELTKYLTRK